MTADDDIITQVIQREGPATNDPNDAGGATEFGISKASNTVAWADGVVTETEARAIYQAKYITGPGFDKIADVKLRGLLVDYGVVSGPMIAIQALQVVVKVKPDYVLGPVTLAALAKMPIGDVITGVVKARVMMVCRIVQKNQAQIRYLSGWVSRCLEFLV